MDILRPKVVLATGDLTDARFSNKFDTGQDEHEWQMYRNVLEKSNVTSKTIWLDIRGNHDVSIHSLRSQLM